jgi:ubiquinone/menaquinone biosynthesis C-methylase UbiE
MSNTNSATMEPSKKQEGQLGHMARYYDLVMAFLTLGREKKLRRVTLDLAQLKTGDKVLEIGCGTGTLTLAAKARVGASGEATGIDIAPEMIAVAGRKAARKGADISFQLGNIENIPFPDHRFDVVICSFMIFHMPDAVRRKGLKEIYRVLKSGGQLFVIDMALPEKPWQRRFVQMHLGHMMQHDVRELAPVLKEYSYNDIETAKANFMGIWFVRGKTA